MVEKEVVGSTMEMLSYEMAACTRVVCKRDVQVSILDWGEVESIEEGWKIGLSEVTAELHCLAIPRLFAAAVSIN